MTLTATDTITIPNIAEDRANALLHALGTLAAADPPSSSAAKYAARLRFALDRLAELRALADLDRGAFAPGRAEAALSILEANIVIAAQFVARARGAELSGRNAGNGRPLPTSTSNADDPAGRNAAERDQMISAKARPTVARRSQPAASIATADDDAAFDAHVVRAAA